MANKCILPPALNRKLRTAVESGDLDVQRLLKATGEERDAILAKYVGKDFSNRVGTRFARVFKTEIPDEVVTDIVDSLARMNKLRAADDTVWSGSSKAWAREYVALNERLGVMTNPGEQLGMVDSAKKFITDNARKIADQEGVVDKGVQVFKSGVQALTSPVYKSLKAAVDISFALRQGFKVFLQSPKTWQKSMVDAFSFIKNIGSKSKMDALMSEFKATYLSHPNYEKLVQDGKLAFGVVEDWFPTTIAEKMPAVGNLFKSSNDAFTVFSQSARFGIANDMYERQLAALGRDLTKDELKSIGTVANSITGYGNLGRAEAISGGLNKLFFSARYVKSQLDTFIMPFNQKLTPQARAEAMRHSVKTLGTIGALMTAASFFGKVEFDTRSSNFGKVKLDGTDAWIDLTAGIGSYITLAAKEITGKSKSSKTGDITELNSGKFGSQTRTSVLGQWFENKLAPAPGLLNQVVGKGELYGGEEPTVGRVARELLVPISTVNTVQYMQNEDTAEALLMSMFDLIGVNVKTNY